jgi:hypothetical protein
VTVRRFDLSEIKQPEREGSWLKLTAYPTRAGVFVYRDGGGRIRRELRPPDEVFDPASLKSLALVPVTNDHPPELLDSANLKQYQVGNVGDSVAREGLLVRAPVVVQDASAVAAVLSGKQQLSCGYEADLDETPGVYDGVPYDAIQRRIRYNHLALVDSGRAGPSCKLKLDAAEEVRTMETCSIGGKSYGLTPEQQQQVMALLSQMEVKEMMGEDAAQGKNPGVPSPAPTTSPNEQTDQSKLLDQKVDAAVKARVDAIEAQHRAEKSKLVAETRARVALEATASQHGVKFDSATGTDALRREVLAKITGEKFDGRDSLYLEARLDAELRLRADRAVGEARGDFGSQPATEAGPDAAREKMLAEQASRWKSSKK